MARPLKVQLGEHEIALNLTKIDRSQLYGSKDLEVVDDHDQVCELATLADDGRTLIGRGGTGFGWLDADGKWTNKSSLKPVDVHGDEIQPIESSYNTLVKLFDTASADKLLEHNIRLVYSIQLGESEAEQELRAELEKGTIFNFGYSYRGGLEADAAFLLMNESQDIMLLVGNPTDFSFIGIQSPITIDEDASSDADVESDLMDFDMI